MKRGKNIGWSRLGNDYLFSNVFYTVNCKIMKAGRLFRRVLVISLISVFTTELIAQEYDDMYFTSSDRKVLKKDNSENDSRATYQSYTNSSNYDDNYTAKDVNPEYIARYRSQALSDNSISENPNYGRTYNEPVEYFPEEEVDPSATVINNYYGNSAYRYTPNRWRFRNSLAFGYNPWGGWNTGFGFSAGFGDPFWNPYRGGGFGWGGGLGWYDPWVAPGFGFYDPFFDPFFCPPGFGVGFFPRRNSFIAGYYTGLYGRNSVVVVGEPVRSRRVVTGARYSRGGTVAGVSRSSVSTVNRSSRSTITSEGSANGRSTVTRGRSSVATTGRGSRDYSNTQNEYYSRSRANPSSGSSSRAYRSEISTRSSRSAYQPSNDRSAYRSSIGTNRSNRSSVSGSNSSRTRSGVSSSGRSSSSRSSVNRSSGSSRNYSLNGSRSNSSSRTYSSPSRNSRSSRSYSPSNSSRSSRSFSPSRSSSPSRSYSSPSRSGGSRSSGRSSGGRSSGSSRSRN